MHSSKMKSMVISFSFLFHLTLIDGGSTTTEVSCGNRLTAPRGVIQTPNFPRSFPVPIKCRWVIDVSDIPATNSSIVVYLTQVYVYKGLSFTEYAYYESESMNFGASLIKEITEGNVFEYKLFRTFRPFLVIEFELDRLEGNHVRVLNNLLDVYGFNVTYQMTEDVPNSDCCSVQHCSYSGNCLVSGDYTNFWCDCFEGFSGKNCNQGPLCFDDRNNPTCQNEGTCKQIGAEAMTCECANGYVGRNCEIHLLDTVDGECGLENCIIQCPYDKEEQQPCVCRNGTKIYNNRSRYECRIKLSNVTSLKSGLITQHGSVESYVGKQKVLLLLQITQRSLVHWSKVATHPYKHLPLSSLVVDIQELQQHNGDSITHSLQIQLKHIENQSSSWNVSCGLMDVIGSWDLDSCIANISPSDATTHCLCPSSGTFAVFLTARAHLS